MADEIEAPPVGAVEEPLDLIRSGARKQDKREGGGGVGNKIEEDEL